MYEIKKGTAKFTRKQGKTFRRKFFIYGISSIHKEIIIICLAMVLSSALALASPLIMQIGIDDGIMSKNFSLLINVSLLLLLIQIFKLIGDYMANLHCYTAGKIYAFNKFESALKKLLCKPLQFFTDYSSGYIMARLGEVWNLAAYLSPDKFSIVGAAIQFIGSIIIMFFVNYKLTLCILIPLPIMAIINNYFRKKIGQSTSDMYEGLALLDEKMSDIILGIEQVKLFNLAEREIKDISNLFNKNIHLEKKNSLYQYKNSALMSICAFLCTFILLLLGGHFIIDEQISFGQYLAFSSYSQYVISPLTSFFGLLSSLTGLKSISKRITEFNNQMDTYDALKETVNIDRIDTIEFSHVSFSYPQRPMLYDDISFKIRKGDVLLINGKNGSGKTTLINLILKMYHPVTGNIFINGIPIESISEESMRLCCSTVSQKPFLFNDTIENNVCIQKNADAIKMAQVFEKVNLSMFINSLPDREKTSIGQDGVRVSGGQVKKIALARALLKKYDVLMLDEPITGLDDESKDIIKTIIEDVRKESIIIVVDHTRTIEIEDSIVLTL